VPKRIGEIARATGVGVETVRFYEREGLIDRPEKPASGWRDYSDIPEAQIGQIKLAQQLGFTLADVKRLRAAARSSELQFCNAVRTTASARLAAVDAEIKVLEARRVALANWIQRCGTRRESSGCPLYADVSAIFPVASAKRRRQ
jgi:MerR family mercuric resistance operon transcriptional regulator